MSIRNATTHAQERSEERLGFALTGRQLRTVKRRILNGKGCCFETVGKDGHTHVYSTWLDGIPVTVVWDPSREKVVTIWRNDG